MDHAPVTAFSETAALYAVLQGDEMAAERIVGAMLPDERAELADHLDRLRAMLTDRFGNIRADLPCRKIRQGEDREERHPG